MGVALLVRLGLLRKLHSGLLLGADGVGARQGGGTGMRAPWLVWRAGHGAVPPRGALLRHQNVHQLPLWDDVVAAAGAHVRHQTGAHPANLISFDTATLIHLDMRTRRYDKYAEYEEYG